MWIICDSYVWCGAQRATDTLGSNRSVPGRPCLFVWLGWTVVKKTFPILFPLPARKSSPGCPLHPLWRKVMGEVSSVKLVTVMKEELHQLSLHHPGMKIMFPILTQRCQWKAGAKELVNCVMATFVPRSNSAKIQHPHI